ncbi:MAG: UvrD-helicase domain-containing protein [Termitinemataceae bacterium]|nr:MAG: UvrD-helicase domain-containing protein [Termitinemataceae bacterium]
MSVNTKKIEGIYLVNASAGSGKTYTLNENVFELINGKVEPESLVLTTFTNKAAAELRKKVRQKLISEGKSDEAARILDGFMGTVNSVCARLLKEYAIYAGLSPAINVLPEDESEKKEAGNQFAAAVSSVISSYAHEIEDVALRLSYGGDWNTDDWGDSVQEIVSAARVNQISPELLREFSKSSWESFEAILPPECDGKKLDKQLVSAVLQMLEDLQQNGSSVVATTKFIKTLKDFKSQYDKSGIEGTTWRNWLAISRGEVGAKDREYVKDSSIAQEVLSHPRLRDDVQRMIQCLFFCAAESMDYYDNYKKKHALMDFADQETKVLDLLENNIVFQEAIKTRLSNVLVDEFQDTNPIQLALFLSLHKQISKHGKSVWVGDPKQSIYGFRGSDAKLMNEVMQLSDKSKILGHSWRSKKLLVGFCNALFTKVFYDTDPKKIILKIPEERPDALEGGSLELWLKNPEEREVSKNDIIANGVYSLLKTGKVKAGEIAILCRKNDHCRDIAASLEALNIHASYPQGKLLDTIECQVALAALRYLHDENDELALAEIVRLLPSHSAHKNWMQSLIENPENVFNEWACDPSLASFVQARKKMQCKTPLEALKLALDAINLLHIIKTWSNPQRRMKNIDKLCGVCSAYLDQCENQRSAATISRFCGFIADADEEESESFGEQTVQVLTCHTAKGLEWPVVILADLKRKPTGNVFGCRVIPSKNFDPKNPLANRSINFWPWPFGSLKKIEMLDTILGDLKETLIEEEVAEQQRLLYVALTRAKYKMIFTDPFTVDDTSPLPKWPDKSGKQKVKVGDSEFDITVKYIDTVSGNSAAPDEEVQYVFPLVKKIKTYPDAKIRASSLKDDDNKFESVTVQEVPDFKYGINVVGKPEPSAFGSAIHGFFALDAAKLSTEKLLVKADQILECWNVKGTAAPKELLKANVNFYSWLKSKYSGALYFRECPITWWKDNYQRMEGYIDLLVELPNGYVIVDHKTSLNDKPEHIKAFAPQLEAYKNAVETATHKKVLATLVHMPIIGRIYEVKGYTL